MQGLHPKASPCYSIWINKCVYCHKDINKKDNVVCIFFFFFSSADNTHCYVMPEVILLVWFTTSFLSHLLNCSFGPCFLLNYKINAPLVIEAPDNKLIHCKLISKHNSRQLEGIMEIAACIHNSPSIVC